jgi:hypothetical protein
MDQDRPFVSAGYVGPVEMPLDLLEEAHDITTSRSTIYQQNVC